MQLILWFKKQHLQLICLVQLLIMQKCSVDEETKNGQKDGSIGHVELNTTISDFTAAVGYIKTDKNGGVGLMDTYGDNINPFDSGNNVYNADAKTVYGSLGIQSLMLS